MKTPAALLTAIVALTIGTPPIRAAVVPRIDDEDAANHCDTLDIPDVAYEIGLASSRGGTFSPDEALDSFAVLGGTPPCPEFNRIGGDPDPDSPEVTVTILNLSGTDWPHVWYVADPGTTLTNFDGIVQPVAIPAFKIDAVGANTPLMSESFSPNGIWEAGESWEFVIQDYTNEFGIPASSFDSIGIESFADGSSGSIVVAFIPEPTSSLLVGLGITALLIRRRES